MILLKKNSDHPASALAYFAYIVAMSRACRDALDDAMQYMYEKDPDDIRIQAAYIVNNVLRMTEALWEDYNYGAPISKMPICEPYSENEDLGDDPQNLLKWSIAKFPPNCFGGIYGGGEPKEWVKEIIDSKL